MTSRERLLMCLRGEIPDCVPVAPDVSNMVPARLTGKPFWGLYLYNDPPIWEAYIDCAKRLGFDSLMDGYFPLRFEDDQPAGPECERFLVYQDEERIVTQRSWMERGQRRWAESVDVYYVADPPTENVAPGKIGLPPVPESPTPLEGVTPVDLGPAGLKRVKELMGEQGLVGVFCAGSCQIHNEEQIYWYYDHPEEVDARAEALVEQAERRFEKIMHLPEDNRPDFLCVGGSGTFVYQTEEMFRRLAFPAVKRVIELASAAGVPTHVHSCGPETRLVEILATETDLTVIDPLEIPPMGDCDLADLKRRFGDKIVLKGNLHTTEVMLRGSVRDVIDASKRAIDAAAEGGRFILSTGDQCGRDTPLENLEAMIETARTYGSY